MSRCSNRGAALSLALALFTLEAPTPALARPAKSEGKHIAPAVSNEGAVRRAGEAARAGHYLEAARAYAEALQSAQVPSYFTNLLRVLRLAEDAEAAVELLQDTLSRYPDFPGRAEAQERILPELRALALEQKGDRAAQPDVAAAEYHLANELRPRARARKKEAAVLARLGRREDALQAYEQTLRDAYQQALTPEAREEVERAMLALRHELALSRADGLRAAAPRAAGAAYEEAYQFKADPALLLSAAAAYRAGGDLARARRALQRLQLTSAGESLARVQVELGEVQALEKAEEAERLLGRGQGAQAEGLLRDAQRQPQTPALRLTLGRALQQGGLYREALDSYRGYLSAGGGSAERLEAERSARALSELVQTQEDLRKARVVPFYRKPWFMAVCAAGALAVGAGVATAVLLPQTNPPPVTDLGLQGVKAP